MGAWTDRVLEIALHLHDPRRHQENGDHTFLGIHPHPCPERARPPEAAGRDADTCGNRVADHVDAEAESHAALIVEIARADGLVRAPARVQLPDVVRCHQLDGLWTEKPPAIELAAIREHLRELQVIFRCAHQPAGAGEIRRLDSARVVRGLLEAARRPAVQRHETGGAGVGESPPAAEEPPQIVHKKSGLLERGKVATSGHLGVLLQVIARLHGAARAEVEGLTGESRARERHLHPP